LWGEPEQVHVVTWRGHFGDKHSSDFYFVKLLRDTLVTSRHIASF